METSRKETKMPTTEARFTRIKPNVATKRRVAGKTNDEGVAK